MIYKPIRTWIFKKMRNKKYRDICLYKQNFPTQNINLWVTSDDIQNINFISKIKDN